MSRLIDENSVIENAEKCAFTDKDDRRRFLEFVKYCVKEAPTAYDVEKVVAELEKQSYEIRLEGGALIGNWHSVIDTNIAIAKVRKGGVE